MHIDGLPYDRAGDKVGKNFSGEVGLWPDRGVPLHRPQRHGARGRPLHQPRRRPPRRHRSRPLRRALGRAAGSQWLSPKDATTPIESGWEAIIWPPDAPSFREDVQILHEIGNEKEQVYDKNNERAADRRPDHRGVSPRQSRHQLSRRAVHGSAHAEAAREGALRTARRCSATRRRSIPQGYLGDPTKFRVVHGGAELFHIYHLHGGGDRWRTNPEADPTN